MVHTVQLRKRVIAIGDIHGQKQLPTSSEKTTIGSPGVFFLKSIISPSRERNRNAIDHLPGQQAEVECCGALDGRNYIPWIDWAGSHAVDPRDAILCVQGANAPSAWPKLMEREGGNVPAMVATYLLGDPICGDFMKASLAAVDIILFQLDQPGPVAPKQIKPRRHSAKRSLRLKNDELELIKEIRFLHVHQQIAEPLTQAEMAMKLAWVTDVDERKEGKEEEERKVLLSRVHREQLSNVVF